MTEKHYIDEPKVCPFLSASEPTKCIRDDCMFWRAEQLWRYVGFDEDGKSQTAYSSGKRPVNEWRSGCALNPHLRPRPYQGA